VSAELDRMVLEARDRYRTAYTKWMRTKNGSDVQARVDAHDELAAAERALLEIGRRER